MTMKRTDLEKNKFLKVNARISRQPAGTRFGEPAAQALDRREQRKLDQAAGLVPFAVKLNADLVKEVQALAQARRQGLNETVAELLKRVLQQAPDKA